jgi:ATP-binding protein involved in chromosome partitioning
MDKEKILQLLKTVNYPGFSRDIVSFGLVNEVTFKDGKASVRLEISSSDSKLPAILQKQVELVLSQKTEISEAEVNIIVKSQTANGQEDAVENKIAKVKRIIAIASGKGGVGKSTLAVNLACAISRQGEERQEPFKVGLMDCDVYGPSVPLLLGSTEKPQLIGENLLSPNESFGVKLMSMGLLIDEDSPVVWRGPMVMKTIQQFVSNVEWGELDFLLIDLPPGTGDAQLSLAQTMPLDGAIVITTPQKAAVDVARRGARMFEKVKVPILGVVENMSYLETESGEKNYLFGKGGGPKTAQELDTKFLGEVPLNQEVREGGDHGIPVITSNPECNSSKAINKIASSIIKAFELE